MNRDRQIRKNIENRKFQAQEEYAKNKPLVSESRLQEQVDYIRPAEQDPERSEDELNEDFDNI